MAKNEEKTSLYKRYKLEQISVPSRDIKKSLKKIQYRTVSNILHLFKIKKSGRDNHTVKKKTAIYLQN